MPTPIHEALWQSDEAAFANSGITEFPETEPPTTTTTLDVIMRPPRAETPASSDETPEESVTPPEDVRGPS